ncbi:hypothetical protein Q5530_26915 [Saccharothrix sp. BKS2]|uniref:hypothetical protein n=1 Tax=Saccharothrix sp. BKS2 TaxID=3064400 RepID=UPI0039E9F212
MDRDEMGRRLVDSAAALRDAGAAIDAVLRDEQRLAHLVDNQDSSPEAAATVSAFGRSVETALAALVDLAAHDSPDRDHPDLTWFEFRCANAVFGKHTDVIGEEPGR